MLGDEAPLSISFVQQTSDKVVCLDAREDLPEPGYCVHGRTRCIHCDRWCWLGADTLPAVESGAARPLCLRCAKDLVQPDSYIGNAGDLPGERHP